MAPRWSSTTARSQNCCRGRHTDDAVASTGQRRVLIGLGPLECRRGPTAEATAHLKPQRALNAGRPTRKRSSWSAPASLNALIAASTRPESLASASRETAGSQPRSRSSQEGRAEVADSPHAWWGNHSPSMFTTCQREVGEERREVVDDQDWYANDSSRRARARRHRVARPSASARPQSRRRPIPTGERDAGRLLGLDAVPSDGYCVDES